MDVIQKIEQEQIDKAMETLKLDDFGPGDTVKVHTRVVEGGKERIQIFEGIVIGRQGSGLNQSFTVRKISYGEGVERVFPLYSPRIARVQVTRRGKVRRAKLNYLRSRLGKKATLVKAQADQPTLRGEGSEGELSKRQVRRAAKGAGAAAATAVSPMAASAPEQAAEAVEPEQE